jgi:hypothetical protein
MAKRKVVDPACCRECGHKGHATMLWHWRHGTYCVLCIRQLMGVCADFVAAETQPQHFQNAQGQKWPGDLPKGNGRKRGAK